MLALFATLLVAAPPFPEVLTLEGALQLLRERSPDLVVADAQVAGARGDRRAAGAIPNPSFSASVGRSFGYDASVCPGCSALSLGVGIADQAAISDSLSGKRGLRVEAATAAVEAAVLSRQDAFRAARLALEQALVDAALQRAQLDFSRETLDFAERTAALNAKRLQAGAISEAELLRSQVAALEAAQAVDVAGHAERAARAQIAALLAVEPPLPDFRVDPGLLERALDLTAPPGSGEDLAAGALARRPDLRALERQESRARAQADLARRQRVPDVTLGANYQQEGTGSQALQPPTLTVSASLPLPIFYQQGGEIARADADLRAQGAQRQKLAAQLGAEVATAYSSLLTSRALVERMKTRLLDRARRARDLVQVQYEKGAASLLELLDAERTYAQIHAEYLQDLHDLWVAHFRLVAAAGMELPS
jgi:cobalt-zinc-cadmium efflux system outer membrane protein